MRDCGSLKINHTMKSNSPGRVESQTGPERKGGPIRLWLVEDHAEVRDLLVRLVNEQPGIQCSRSFASAEAMLSALERESSPDLILSDLNMPGRSGIESISAARALAPATPVVIMTAIHDSRQQAAALEAGAAGFLTKTCDSRHFFKVIRQACANPRLAGSLPEKRGKQRQPKALAVMRRREPLTAPWGLRAFGRFRSLVVGLTGRRWIPSAPWPGASGLRARAKNKKGKGLEETLAA